MENVFLVMTHNTDPIKSKLINKTFWMAANTISKVKREQRTGINMHNSHQAKDYLANTKKNSQKMVKKKKERNEQRIQTDSSATI